MTTILIVEDNEMNRDMLYRRLQKRGYTTLLAMDGIEGLEMAALFRDVGDTGQPRGLVEPGKRDVERLGRILHHSGCRFLPRRVCDLSSAERCFADLVRRQIGQNCGKSMGFSGAQPRLAALARLA